MASAQSNQYPHFNVHRRSHPNGSVQKYRPRRLTSSTVQLAQEGDRRRSLPASISQDTSVTSAKQGRKRRVSESTAGWHPVSRVKRPRSDGDVSTSRPSHFSPHARLTDLLPRDEERSLEKVR